MERPNINHLQIKDTEFVTEGGHTYQRETGRKNWRYPGAYWDYIRALERYIDYLEDKVKQ